MGAKTTTPTKSVSWEDDSALSPETLQMKQVCKGYPEAMTLFQISQNLKQKIQMQEKQIQMQAEQIHELQIDRSKLQAIYGKKMDLWKAMNHGYERVNDISDLKSKCSLVSSRVDISGLNLVIWPAFFEKLVKFASSHEMKEIFEKIEGDFVADIIPDITNVSREDRLATGLERLFSVLNAVPGDVEWHIYSKAHGADASAFSMDRKDARLSAALVLTGLECRRLILEDKSFLDEVIEKIEQRRAGVHSKASKPSEDVRPDAEDALMQLIGCMQAASNECASVEYGIATNVNKFWAIHRPNDTHVWISPEVDLTNSGADSVLFMLLWVQTLALTSRLKHYKTPLKALPLFTKRQDKSDGDGAPDKRAAADDGAAGDGGPQGASTDQRAGGGKMGGALPKKGKKFRAKRSSLPEHMLSVCERENILNFSIRSGGSSMQQAQMFRGLASREFFGSFDTLFPLTVKDDRATFLVQRSEGLAVVKCFSEEAEKNHEVTCLSALSKLRGKGVPQLLAPSCKSPVPESKWKFSFMMTCVGERPFHDYRPPAPLSLAALKKALHVVREIHKLEVVHRDVQRRNVVLGGALDDDVFLVDFGSAMLKSEFARPSDFELECRDEIAELQEQIWNAGEQRS